MMELLTVKELRDYLETLDDELPIILGDDEELNGVHGCYFVELVGSSDDTLQDVAKYCNIEKENFILLS